MQALLYQRVPNREGHKLATDVWLPDGPGPFPVLVTRTPYNRTRAVESARYFTERGYAYVIQDTRGKFDSEGIFRPLIDEAEDGQATLDWIANQKWCNGRIGLTGKATWGSLRYRRHPAAMKAFDVLYPGFRPVAS